MLDLLKRETSPSRGNGYARGYDNGAGSGNSKGRRSSRPTTTPTRPARCCSRSCGSIRRLPATRAGTPDDPPDKVKNGWVWNVKGVRQVPSACPSSSRRSRSSGAFSSSKARRTFETLPATASPRPAIGGAGKWRAEVCRAPGRRRCVVSAGQRPAGRDHADAVARSLAGKAARIRIVDLPGLPEKGDVSDWFAAGGTVEAFNDLVEAATDWTPGASEAKRRNGNGWARCLEHWARC